MQKFVRIISLILILSMSVSFIPSEILAGAEMIYPKIEKWGYLKIITRHHGLAIKVDGDLIGFSPLEILTLEPGQHYVEVHHPDQANWLDRNWVGEVNITVNDTSVIEVVFNRNYSINSQPFGAAVLIDNQKLGETPIFLRFSETEIKQVVLSKAGYQDTILTIGSSNIQFFDIKLRKMAKKPSLILAPGKFNLKKKAKTKRSLFAAIGLAAVSGALGIYFRQKANKEYDQYLQFGDPQKFNESFDQSKKFDNYASVSLVTFQASFILSFYLYLKKVNN